MDAEKTGVFARVYNSARSVAYEAATAKGVAADRMSVMDTVRWLVGIEGDADLSVILAVPKRAGRAEPRVTKRRPERYTRMTRVRKELRKELLDKGVAA